MTLRTLGLVVAVFAVACPVARGADAAPVAPSDRQSERDLAAAGRPSEAAADPAAGPRSKRKLVGFASTALRLAGPVLASRAGNPMVANVAQQAAGALQAQADLAAKAGHAPPAGVSAADQAQACRLQVTEGC